MATVVTSKSKSKPKRNTEKDKTRSNTRKEWHYQPELPIKVSPVFHSPFNLKHVFKWFLNSWFPLSERIIIVGLAFLSWCYFHPTLNEAKTIQIG